MKKTLLIVFYLFFCSSVFSQITVNTDSPNNDINHLVNNVILSSGVQASNFSFEGHPKQIAYFDASNSNIGLSGGIVLSTGDVSVLAPSFSGTPASVTQIPPISDPDLLDVANSVPGMIGQSFSVSSINDVAVIEFDFVPSSDTVSFNYVFGSQEYFGFENSSFNDVFGFFISGPGISGPYSSPAAFPDGSINVAVFESQESNSEGVELPITVSSICSTASVQYNSQLFVNNQSFSTVAVIDGFTVSMKAELVVQCGETYHIRLAIADGIDNSLSSFVFLEEKSFSSTQTNIANDIGQDSLNLIINCGEEVTLTAQVNSSDEYNYLWSTNETTQSINVGPGTYWFTASNDGCDVNLYIPNSFTPNGDYDIELLVYRGDNIIDFDFSIFNRWGELMFQTNNLSEFWDGKYKNRVVPPGTYSYVAKIYGKDAKYKFQNGTVNVLQ